MPVYHYLSSIPLWIAIFMLNSLDYFLFYLNKFHLLINSIIKYFGIN